jgi:hypothetical protein
MSIKRIFKRGKHKPSASEDHPAPSTDTPTGTRSSSPSPGSARGVWDLVTQPLLLMSSPNLPSRQQKNDWPSLEALSTFLNQTGVFSPLAEVINNLRWFVQLHEVVCYTSLLHLLYLYRFEYRTCVLARQNTALCAFNSRVCVPNFDPSWIKASRLR